jgi:hypothetical protein
MWPRDMKRVKVIYSDFRYALKNRGCIWFRGIVDLINDLKSTAQFLYPEVTVTEHHLIHKEAQTDNICSKRIYLPVVYSPSGRLIHRSNELSYMAPDHIFFDFEKKFKYQTSTIEDLVEYMSDFPEGYALFNVRGKTPTTEDLQNKKVFMYVYNVSDNLTYEPNGEIKLIGAGLKDYVDVDYISPSLQVKQVTDSRWDDINTIIKQSFEEKCSGKDVDETTEIIKADLVEYYKTM